MKMNIGYYIDHVIGHPWFLIFVSLFAVITKLYITYYLLKNRPRTSTSILPWATLLITIITTMVTEAIWIPKLIQEMYPYLISYSHVIFFIRIAWIFYSIQTQALSLFLESIIEQNYTFSKKRIFAIGISVSLAFYYIYIAFFNFHIIDKQTRIDNYEYIIFKITFLYMIPLIGVSLCKSFNKIRKKELPKILEAHSKFFIQYLLIPYMILELFSYNPFTKTSSHKTILSWLTTNYAFLSVSTLFLTYALWYVAKKIICLRFLNLESHVHSHEKFDFINDFKIVLEQLSHATDVKELKRVIQTFFNEAFGIEQEKINLYIRPSTLHQKPADPSSFAPTHYSSKIEEFINQQTNMSLSIDEYLKKHKILIYDEIEFTNFYESSDELREILEFLKTIKADIILPLFDQQNIIGYITVGRKARDHKFYNSIERDEMLVFASYLNNVITLLNHKNLQAILQQEKELKEELYNKLQEINLYKESIRSFLRTSKERKIGIIFYNNNKLKQGNKAAEDLIGFNLLSNNNEGHPTKKTLRKVGKYVQDYKQPQTATITDSKGETLICTGFLNIDGSHAIIIIHYPEIADVVKRQIDLLKDPSKWDYLLYLETTQPGKLIHKLLPSSTETFINFKIDLLKTALNAKATLIDVPEKDIESIIGIIHHVSLKEHLESLNIEGPEKNNEIGIKLCGINPLFGSSNGPALLETLKNGTLFIKNVHLLSLETQKALTNIIKYGVFNELRGNIRIFTDVRIICYSNKNLEQLVKEGLFYEPLYQELSKSILTMPSLLTISEQELSDLASALSEQVIKNEPLKNLLSLSAAEKNKISQKRPISLHELKTKIHQLVEKKTISGSHEQGFTVEGAYYGAPELEELKSLGKQALKDPKIMEVLHQTFKKQAEIAKFLGVNRSSVSRRLKMLNEGSRK